MYPRAFLYADKLELSTESDMETLAALAVDSGGFCPLPSFFLPGQGGEPAPGPTGRLRWVLERPHSVAKRQASCCMPCGRLHECFTGS